MSIGTNFSSYAALCFLLWCNNHGFLSYLGGCFTAMEIVRMLMERCKHQRTHLHGFDYVLTPGDRGCEAAMQAAQQEARIKAGSLDFYRVCLPAVPILILGFLCLEGKEVQHPVLAKSNMPRTYISRDLAVQLGYL